MMKYSKLTVTLIILLLAILAREAAASPVDGFNATGDSWQQVNSSGFGDPITSAVSALAVFNNQLYAGTRNATNGTQVFRSPDGAVWSAVTQPGFGIAHDIRPPTILDLTVFRGRLYASTGQGDGPGQIWRTVNGSTWAAMVIHGFGSPDTVDITALVEYNNYLYAGAGNLVSGAQIWRSFSGDNNTWVQVAPAAGGIGARITGLAVFNDALYAAVESEQTVQVWRSSGGPWTVVVSSGFGDSTTRFIGELAEFGGYLYAGAGSTTGGAQLWRTGDGVTWQQSNSPGFGDPNNQEVETLFAWQNVLYAGVKNTKTGIETWRSIDGAAWEQANTDGFGDSSNTGSGWDHAVAGFLGDLYVGTSNTVEGGELWRLQPPHMNVYLPLALR